MYSAYVISQAAASSLLIGIVKYQMLYFEAMLSFATFNTSLVFQALPVSDEIYVDNVTIIVTAIDNLGAGESSDAVTDTICKYKCKGIILRIYVHYVLYSGYYR